MCHRLPACIRRIHELVVCTTLLLLLLLTGAGWGQDGSEPGVYAGKYYADGNSSNEFRANTTTAGDQTASTVAMNGVGDFVIAWTWPDADGKSDIFAQRYSSAGLRVGSEFVVNDAARTGDQRAPAAARTPSGRSVIYCPSS